MDQLLKIMELLRDKQHGCAWDKQQTFQSIAPHTLEETYEVIDAIESENYQHLPNELGDLLFQVVFYAQIGKEAGLFDFAEVVRQIKNKLLTRHPHVFPDASISSFGSTNQLTPGDVENAWELIKAEERKQLHDSKQSPSALDDIPHAQPAIMRAKKLQSRAAQVNFDWSTTQEVIAKVKEELNELEEAIAENNSDHINEEVGDLLFTVVNLSRHLKTDPESSLRAANKKFESRFRSMEGKIKADQCDFKALTLIQLESYWQKVKLAEAE